MNNGQIKLVILEKCQKMVDIKNELEDLSQLAQYMQEDVFDEVSSIDEIIRLNVKRGEKILNLISKIEEKLKKFK